MRPARVNLDYVAAARRPSWLGVALLAIALAVAGELLLRYRDSQFELARLETSAGLVAAPQRLAPGASEARLDEETRNAETVVRQLALPWAMLVQAIEEAATRDVALLQLQPDADSRLLRLTAEARHRDAMFEYVRRLGAAKGLAGVHVVSHQVRRDDLRRPVQFSVQASMRGVP